MICTGTLEQYQKENGKESHLPCHPCKLSSNLQGINREKLLAQTARRKKGAGYLDLELRLHLATLI